MTLAPAELRAQGGTTRGGGPPVDWVRACFDPNSGDVYLIGFGGLPQRCRTTSHREILWPVIFPDGGFGSRTGDDRAASGSGRDTDARRGRDADARREGDGSSVEQMLAVEPCQASMPGVCNAARRQRRYTGVLTCLNGLVAVTGGVLEPIPPGVEVESSRPDRQRPERWIVRLYNTRDAGATVRLYARCAPAGER